MNIVPRPAVPLPAAWGCELNRLVHTYIPRNRTPRGEEDFVVEVLPGSRGPILLGLPRFPLSVIIIAQVALFVKSFFRESSLIKYLTIGRQFFR